MKTSEYELVQEENNAKARKVIGINYSHGAVVNHEPAGKNIVLIGFMGTGKSSIGRLIATRLGREFVDTDQLVVKKAGMEIADMFRKHGEAYFREQEAVALQSLQKRSNLVIGTGGGVVLRPENVGVLRHLGFIVWLTASEEVIYQRVSANTKRPLMQTDDPRKTIHELLEQREPLYSGAAHFSVDTSSLSHSRIADMIISAAQA